MHIIKSAVDKGAISSIPGQHLPPGTVLTTSGAMSTTFSQIGVLDLWSDHCVELASALLQPHTPWPGDDDDDDDIWQFQLPLIAALYIDSTRQAGRASNAFVKLLKLPNITGITMTTWAYPDVYDRMKLAGYWYMALFQEPLYHPNTQNSPFQNIGHVIMQTIEHCSEITLSVLSLLDHSVKHLRATASSLINLEIRASWPHNKSLVLVCTLPTGPISHSADEHWRKMFNPWVLFHLESLFPQSSILAPMEVEQLKWTDTPEQVHIAKARLALYDSFEGEDRKETKQLRVDPQVLKMFLWSKDYVVCTGALKWCLNLVPMSQADDAGMFIPETVGYQWIEHLIQVLCRSSGYERLAAWRFLAEHLVPKWIMLPPSWRSCFASAFLFSTVKLPCMPELHVYQHFAGTLEEPLQLDPFFSFLLAVVEHTKAGVTWGQLTSIEHWLALLLALRIRNQDQNAPLEHILAARKQDIVEETMKSFGELPMADSGVDE